MVAFARFHIEVMSVKERTILSPITALVHLAAAIKEKHQSKTVDLRKYAMG